MTRRMTISLPEELYSPLSAFAEENGFSSPKEVVYALVSVFVSRKPLAASMRMEESGDANARYIEEMFSEMESWEPVPEAGHVPRIRRRRNG